MENAFLLKHYRLTGRELQVVNMIMKVFTNRRAASELFVTEKTVKFHLTNSYKKIGVTSRSKMIVKVSIHAGDVHSHVAPI